VRKVPRSLPVADRAVQLPGRPRRRQRSTSRSCATAPSGNDAVNPAVTDRVRHSHVRLAHIRPGRLLVDHPQDGGLHLGIAVERLLERRHEADGRRPGMPMRLRSQRYSSNSSCCWTGDCGCADRRTKVPRVPASPARWNLVAARALLGYDQAGWTPFPPYPPIHPACLQPRRNRRGFLSSPPARHAADDGGCARWACRCDRGSGASACTPYWLDGD
jgi:hypothetical protein